MTISSWSTTIKWKMRLRRCSSILIIIHEVKVGARWRATNATPCKWQSTRTRFECSPTGNARSMRKKEPRYKKWMQSNIGNVKSRRGRKTVSKDLPYWISCWLSAGMLSALFSRYPFKAAVNLCYANTDFQGKTLPERKSDISLRLAKKNIKFALRYLAVEESLTVVALI